MSRAATAADPKVAEAKTADKLNSLFPLLGPHDAAQSATPAANTDQRSSDQPADRASHAAAWEALWRDASFLPWERGAPHPALHDALKDHVDILGDALRPPADTSGKTSDDHTKRRRKALVPGCGSGYDVFMLRSFGYDVTGLDVSEGAVQKAAQVEKQVDAGQGPGEGTYEGVGYRVVDESIGMGKAIVVKGDFFAMADRQEDTGQWDLIFDYTFLSALPPSLRPLWARTYARLLAPSGRLVCVEFPTDKPTDTGGPPWGLPEEVYLAHLQHPGVALPYDAQGKVVFDQSKAPAENGLERMARWRAVRSHPAGEGKDWVSVWRHVDAAST